MLPYKILIEWHPGIAGRFVPWSNLYMCMKRYLQDSHRTINCQKEKTENNPKAHDHETV